MTTTQTAATDLTDMTTRLARVVAPLARDLGALESIERLEGGMFATTYRLTFAGGGRAVAKMAPTDSGRLMRYEHGILGTEELVYRLAYGRPELLMPTVLLSDFSREHIETDILVVTHLDGVPWRSLTEQTPEQQATIRTGLGRFMAALHTVTGTRFGYPAAPTLQGDTWPEAFAVMFGALLDDAATWGSDLPTERIIAAVARHEEALALVETPHLIHTDLWEGNIFIDPDTLAITGIIDTERAFWGDPLFEFVGADQVGIGPVPASLADSYRGTGGDLDVTEPPRAGALSPADARLLLYRAYMYTVMLVEPAPRAYSGDWVAAQNADLTTKLGATLDLLLA
ncbi:Predicted kinase, aminoglycoside phosphotransferase (APT) family [Sanguibacter gelidistatuariae]|uniref:Predicted kinase, aminoglycoside phosphotransferase (APT) family n=1 Tax=Sanguibacter gelidistatuariae TaxID=1814289 RepID=A0A1G6H1M0_9MICO|nr:aminoglycoside phosphotransferase family protein [Sanguibacter gelidistatuariae]SDB87286.1 Predicted kinase, aminoglycoside phosphotransferase (APT) family [Sanguibacter gelidistatuariae]